MAICMARQSRSRYKPPRTLDEVRALLQQLFNCECPATTPSNKNVFHIIGPEELKHYFD